MDKALTLDLTGLSKLDSLAKLSIRAYQRKDEDRLKSIPREGQIDCNALQFCSLSPFIELGTESKEPAAAQAESQITSTTTRGSETWGFGSIFFPNRARLTMLFGPLHH